MQKKAEKVHRLWVFVQRKTLFYRNYLRNSIKISYFATAKRPMG